MKTRPTLTIEKKIVEKAKMIAASRGISLSRLFEEIVQNENTGSKKTESQVAAERFLERLKSLTPINSLKKSDNQIVREDRGKEYN